MGITGPLTNQRLGPQSNTATRNWAINFDIL